ncbi:MAG: segregation/condensation protein A [Chitinivibrionales bacterium]|nr:segregation/condensation protein A [Chitinivibrionales bacterium]
MNQEYEVKLDLFEGPLDLLLYCVNKSEVAITEISVAQVTEQYLQYLDLMKELNIDVAAEYLHMAATLLRLKSRELVPQQAEEDLEQEEGGIHTKEQLIAQLLEYKKYKEAAGSLRVHETEQFGAFTRGAADRPEAAPESEDGSKIIGNVNIYDLLSAFMNILNREKEEEPGHVVQFEEAKIDDRIEHILTVLQDNREVRFDDLFRGNKHRIVLVVTFMALLELVKMQEIEFRQEERFGEIFVIRRFEKEVDTSNKDTETS